MSARSATVATGAALLVLAGVVAGALGTGTAALGACVSTPDPTGINASADTYVSGGSPSSNFGTATSLVANATGPVTAHLQFAVAGSNGATSATLAVYSTSSGTVQTAVYAEPSTWDESTLTYNTPPPTRGTSLGKLTTLVAGCYSTLAVPITGDGTYSFVLTTAATANRYMASRETATPPQLLIAGATQPPPTTTTAPPPTTTTAPPPTTTTAPPPTTTTAPPPTTTTAPPPPPPTTTAPPPSSPLIVAAGDIACAASDTSFNGGLGTSTACRGKYTGQLIQSANPVALLPLGDEQYNSGSSSDFTASYDKLWGVPGLPGGGTLKSISKPVVGNHEYGTSGAGGYTGYFGSAAGPSGTLCYSYDIGSWHIIAINTECTRLPGATGCAVGSAQETWLKSDIASHPNQCTLAYGHRPRWASSSFGSADIAPLIADMVAGKVDLYLTGHAHSYERFAPQDANGVLDTTSGITQVTIGTGGSFYTGTGTIAANSVVRKTNLFGIMKLVLGSSSAQLSYVPENSTFTDTVTVPCH